MGTKRTPLHRSRNRITPQAVARWRKVGPDALFINPDGSGYFCDEELGALLDRPILISFLDMDKLKAALDAAAGGD